MAIRISANQLTVFGFWQPAATSDLIQTLSRDIPLRHVVGIRTYSGTPHSDDERDAE
jgi:hypothetical protein